MKCPACSGELTRAQLGTLELDACSGGCGGIWFDRDELFEFDEKHEFPGHAILKLAAEKQSVKVTHDTPRECPKCAGENLVRQFIDVKHDIEIDQCWSCSGIWFDPGEVNDLRSQYETYEDRQKAVNEYVDQYMEGVSDALEAREKEWQAEYEAKYGNRVSAFFSGFKDLLGF